MLVDAARSTSFFPNIYNEDWLFLLGDGVPVQGGTIRPYGAAHATTLTPTRPRRRLRNSATRSPKACTGCWTATEVSSRQTSRSGHACCSGAARSSTSYSPGVDVAVTDDVKRQAMRNSLEAARGRSAFITPRLCQDFVQAWTRDLRRWEAFITGMPAPSNLDKFLAEMGMSHTMHRSARVPEPDRTPVSKLLSPSEFDEPMLETLLPASAVAAMVALMFTTHALLVPAMTPARGSQQSIRLRAGRLALACATA